MAENLSLAALRYAELGYSVFPCVPQGKAPLTPRGFLDATANPEQIRRWWEQYPEANVAIVTAGLVVVDIDCHGNPWPDDPDHAADLATAGAVAMTPRGGKHYFFRQPDDATEWRCTTGAIAANVDTRADGGYIVVSPSTTVDGIYQWVEGLELDQPPDQLPVPPPWLSAKIASGKSSRTTMTANTASHGNDQSNTIPAGQRNTTLARLGGSMRRVGMSRNEIAAALHQVNKDRCSPPLPDREVDKIATSISRYEPNNISVALAEKHYEQMQSKTDDAAEPEYEIEDPGPMPDELLQVPGFISQVMDYTLKTAPYPEPILAFAGALSLQSLLAGRKVCDIMNNRTNLYILSLANSGVGKDHARKVNARILHHAGMENCLGTSFASGEGIEDWLSVNPAALFQVDEVDGMLLRITQSKESRYENIVSMLLQLYSTASSIHVMRAKAGQERTVIHQPCLSIFGTAVPRYFYESLSARMLANGFVARLLIFESRCRSPGQEVADYPIPDAIIAIARWWAEYQPGGAGNLNNYYPVPAVVPQTPEAKEVMADVRSKSDRGYSESEQRDDQPGMAIWARVYEKVRRLALIYAVSENHEQPCITAQAAEWSGRIVDHITRRMLFMANRYIYQTQFEGKLKQLINMLDKWQQQHGDAWMPFWRITRRFPWSNKEHAEAREALVGQQVIEVKTQLHAGRGRPGMGYRLIPQNPIKKGE